MRLGSVLAIAGVTAALISVSGCGGSQEQVPGGAALQQDAKTAKGRVSKPATSGDLIYAPGGCGGTCILSYPQGKLVGSFSTFGSGVCSDAQGNVFLTHNDTVYEYAHGGTTPIAALSLPGNGAYGCSVDPVTGNLAVVFSGYGATVAVFPPGSATPTLVETYFVSFYCGYDNAGNLFVSGHDGTGHPAISEIPYGQTTATTLSINGDLGSPGQIEWDGSYMTYESIGPAVGEIGISRLTIAGSVATVIGTTSFKSKMRYASQTWIYKDTVLVPYGKKPVRQNKIGLWMYPQGGRAERLFKFADSGSWNFHGVTVSVAPSTR